jgi:hypothetical protein
MTGINFSASIGQDRSGSFRKEFVGISTPPLRKIPEKLIPIKAVMSGRLLKWLSLRSEPSGRVATRAE